MKLSGILDIVNSIVFFQLIFFSVFLFLKGGKIPSVRFLKIHLICQSLVFVTYPFWRHDYAFLKYLFLLSQPSLFLLGPTFYFYVRSRLYRDFVFNWKLLLHGIPAMISLLIIIPVFTKEGDFHSHIMKLNHNLYYFIKVQMLVYNTYTLVILYKYKSGLRQVTSASEHLKLGWLLLITYGILFTSLSDFIIFCIPQFTDRGVGYLLFFIFINIFFFKAIIQPDQFLGLDNKELPQSKISGKKGAEYFILIERIMNDKQLFLDPELSLHDLSRALNISDRIVSQVIKQNTSLNFCDYVNLKRINYAKERLITTTKAQKNVLEILYESGFNSKSVFNSQFRKHTGLSPTEFREINNIRAPEKKNDQ